MIRLQSPLFRGDPQIREDVPVSKKSGDHRGPKIEREPAAPNLLEQLGEYGAELIHQGAVNPSGVLRARSNPVAHPPPGADFGVNARVDRNGAERFMRENSEISGLPREVQE